MKEISGLGQGSRRRLGEILRQAKGTVSVGQVSDILHLSRQQAAKLLARWERQGWLSRVRQGLYVPVPLESRSRDVSLDDPWIVAERVFAPCYVAGWSAVEHWDLTEQVFRSVLIVTTRNPRDRRPVIGGTSFVIRTIKPEAVFGTKPVWRGQVKVDVSDPTRTVLDLLNDPSMGGGLRPTVDVIRNYLGSKSQDLGLLIEYARRLGNGAVFKRLGFLLERLAPDKTEIISECRRLATTGNAKLDPSLKSVRLVTRWRLWVPANWIAEAGRD